MSAEQSPKIGGSAATVASVFPRLREDLSVTPAGDSHSGAPMWVIHDPLQQRYFQIDEQTKELLSIWRHGLTASELAQIASKQLGRAIVDQQFVQLLELVRNCNLTEEDACERWRDFEQRNRMGRQPLILRLAKSFIFFKAPLLQPQSLLERMALRLEFLFSWRSVAVVGLIGIIGLYLVSRQWGVFLDTFGDVVSFEGAALLLLSLLFLKSAHELGHALTAVRFGCYVPNMGVAFMVLMPLLYTDITDSWRLSSRRQRLLIGGAGIAVEIALACIATFLWVFLPDGAARAAAFMVATTGWILSLAINLNPCMKFDGYYLLADLIRIDNLQPRAFALARWKLRQILFAPDLGAPELLSPKMRNGLIIYAMVTWVYRLALFTAIALLVYHFTSKVFGVLLGLFVIGFLIVLPIVREIKTWPKIGHASLARATASIVAASALIVVLIVPWSTHIRVPAVLEAGDLTQIYPPRAGKIINIDVRRGDSIRASDPLVYLEAREIDNEIAAEKIKRDIVELRLARAAADRLDREASLVLANELIALQTKLHGLQEQKDELIIRAPLSGHVLEIDSNIHPGQWIGKTTRLALVSAQKNHVVKGYVPETNLHRLVQDAEGRFIPDDLNRSPIPVKLKNVARAAVASIDIVELASPHGGRVAAHLDTSQRLIPIKAQYLVELEPKGLAHQPRQVVRGVVELKGAPESLLAGAWRRVSNVLIRESGF